METSNIKHFFHIGCQVSKTFSQTYIGLSNMYFQTSLHDSETYFSSSSTVNE